ncbi:MAG: amidase family protein [Blastomonas sp.]
MMLDSARAELGAIETVNAVASGALSAIEACEAAIARIEALDGPINAVVVRDFDRAREAAREADTRIAKGKRAPLLGLPMTVKESFDIAGLPSSWGLSHAANFIPEKDSAVVSRLKAAGAVILGKTNIPPQLADLQADNPVYGRTVNPHDAERTPGGSSGGAAAALSAGMVAAEYGSDIGGSIRTPAHFCGVWGHKPTFTVVSPEGHVYPGTDGARPAMAVVGPLARNADDLDLLLTVTLDRPLPRNPKPLADTRFLYAADHPLIPTASGVRQVHEMAVAAIEKAGGTVIRAHPLLDEIFAYHADYMRMLGIAMAMGAPGPDGRQATAADWFALCDQQARCQRTWRALFGEVDFVLAPVISTTAHGHYGSMPLTERSITIDGTDHPYGNVFTWAGFATFPGLPSTSTPLGMDGHLPVGIQVIGPDHADHDCIAMASQIVKALDI